MTMTVNTVNNLEQMLSNTTKALRNADKNISGVDKTVADFKSVMDKTLNHAEKKSDISLQKPDFDKKDNCKADIKIEEDQVVSEVKEQAVEATKQVVDTKAQAVEVNNKTISDLKNSSLVQMTAEVGQAIVENIKDVISTEELPKNWAEFKEVLTQITDEVNAEASLDLTLARDISEIIAQLKEAVENAAKAVDGEASFSIESNGSEENVDIAEELLVALENINAQEENSENTNLEQENQDSETAKIPFEQVLTFTEKVVDSKLDTQLVIEKSDENVSASELPEISKTDIIEFAENLVDEVVSSKQAQENSDVESELLLDEELFKDLRIESVKVEADASGNESLMQNQTPEEQGLKAMLTAEPEVFELKIDNVQGQTTVQTPQAKTIDVNPSRIIDQVTKHLEVLQNNSKVNIVLNPESLGKVNIQLLTTKEGLAAQFTVTTQEARDLLMKGLDGLKESLVSHGVGVDNVSVKVLDSQKSEYRQDWTEHDGSRGGNKGQGQPNREEKEKGLFEKMMTQTEEKENGNV